MKKLPNTYKPLEFCPRFSETEVIRNGQKVVHCGSCAFSNYSGTKCRLKKESK